ncbi:MAG: thiamine-phosphate kinase [Acidobacteriota bacterium]
MRLSEFGEMRLIERIERSYSGIQHSKKDIAIGDDCAVIRSLLGREILITTDALIEDIHFSFRFSSPEWIGEKAVYVNLSDIASMGGKPEFILLTMGLPPEMKKKTALRLVSGIDSGCRSFGVSLLGGDTCSSPGKVFISITAVGSMGKGKAILRSGARPSDILFLSGSVGGSSLGLRLLRKGMEYHSGYWKEREKKEKKERGEKGERSRESYGWDRFYARRAMNCYLRPRPHIEEGRFLAETGLATAMIDLSDGLSSDLHNLCRASGVGAVIRESDIPVDASLTHFLKSWKAILDAALSGGEDYCLLVAVSEGKADKLERLFQRKFSRPLYRIGEIIPASRGIGIVSRTGLLRRLPKTGYEHFKSR